MVVIDFPITIIGESKDGCTIVGGLKMTGKKKDDVNVKHLTISQSNQCFTRILVVWYRITIASEMISSKEETAPLQPLSTTDKWIDTLNIEAFRQDIYNLGIYILQVLI